MAVTLQSIASRVGVAKSTVSLVLRDHELGRQFRPEVREHIKQVAKEMGYRPNFFAQQLSHGRSKLLMVCLSYLQDPHNALVAESFERRAGERGYRVLINLFHDREDPMEFHQEILGGQGISAVAVLGGETAKLTDDAVRTLADSGISIVMVGREIDHSKIGCILCNHTLGGELSTRHVYEQGLKDVWFLDIQYKSFFVDIAIQQAIYNTAIEFNRPTPLKIPVEWKPSCEIIESAYSAVKRELVNRPHPEAILTTSDAVALGAVRAISESGGEVGKNVAVVGYDGGVLGICCNTPLTSVKQPTSQMGEMAADLLIEMAESNGDHPAQRIELSPELIVRSSSVLQKRESQ